MATRAWFRVSLQTFGGPAGQIAVMHRELVDELRWIGERRFLHALSYCTLLPGPEAQQLAIYLGWLLNGTVGGLIAGVLFVLPGYLAIMALSVTYAEWGHALAIEALFAGVAPAVLAIVAHAVVRVGKRALPEPALIAIAVGAFVALAVFDAPFPLALAFAGLAGYALGRVRPDGFRAASHGGDEDENATPPLIPDDALHGERPSLRRTVGILALGLVAWILPVALATAVFGGSSIYVEEATFFGGTALITFGGAYAVLAFVAQRAVETYGWLAPGDMITGLAKAETTPGPLIMVVQFVGFMGAYNAPRDLSPLVAAVLAATLVTWVTFVPCFLFIYLGAPHVEALRHNRRLADALTGITAAVVGVIANLALYFALHVLFTDVKSRRWGVVQLDIPNLGSFEPRAAAVAALAFYLSLGRNWSVVRTLGVCAAAGSTLHLLGSFG